MVAQKHTESGARSETLTIPELEQSKTAVLNTLASVHTRRSYAFAIDGFIAWYCSEPRSTFNRSVVVRYRSHLEGRSLSASTINLHLSAIRGHHGSARKCHVLSKSQPFQRYAVAVDLGSRTGPVAQASLPRPLTILLQDLHVSQLPPPYSRIVRGKNPQTKGDKTMFKHFAVLAAPAALSMFLSVAPLRADGPDEISFNLVANPKFSQCLGNDPYNPPMAKVTVGRGTANDVMIVECKRLSNGIYSPAVRDVELGG